MNSRQWVRSIVRMGLVVIVLLLLARTLRALGMFETLVEAQIALLIGLVVPMWLTWAGFRP